MSCSSPKEILVVPFFGQGHLLPSMELIKHLLSRDFKITLILFTNLSSSIPSSLHQHPLFQLIEVQTPQSPFAASTPTPQNPFPGMRQDQAQLTTALESLFSSRTQTQTQNQGPILKLPACAIVDTLIVFTWTANIFKKFNVPTVGFFTSGGCSTAMEYATWKVNTDDLKPGDTRLLPGLPEEVAITVSDLKRRPRPSFLRGGGPAAGPGGGPPRTIGPPNPGELPKWLPDVEDSLALMINTCDDLERPFLEYVAKELGKPVWGIGPLLPDKYWESAGSLLRDRDIRSSRRSNVTEDEVLQWLDSKPRASVLYVSFGTELGPTMEEYPRLAEALEEWTGPFVWVIQPGSGRPGPPRPLAVGNAGDDDDGYFPHGLDKKVGERGLIIRGWAPQLLILSHQSTGGFLSHCGWNSTVEAIGRGVPFLTWPIRGDQYYDAKLVVAYLKVGYMISDDMSKSITKDDISKGIKNLMEDEKMKERAEALGTKFQNGFPASSLAAFDAFRDFINQKVK